MTYFSSKETKVILKISDCALMHMRTSGKLKYRKKGNAFFYQLPVGTSLLQHPLGYSLLNWHKEKHQSDIDNKPLVSDSSQALEKLLTDVLLPIERKFGRPNITYGFTSSALKSFISKSSPYRTTPDIDQHASYETNSVGSRICSRGGAACDLILTDKSSAEVVKFIASNLVFDRMYFYGSNRPIHVSVNQQPVRHLQVMKENEEGKLYPSFKAFGDDAIKLAESL